MFQDTQKAKSSNIGAYMDMPKIPSIFSSKMERLEVDGQMKVSYVRGR